MGHACKKGELHENQAPETFTSVEAINLSGEHRLNSLVTLKWWGTDPDGIVEQYEFSFDQQTWYVTTEQDSTFLFTITAGSDSVDIDFWVRAVDAAGAVDETPAYLSIPLKNTPPEVAFTTELIPTDTAFNVLTMAWQASDADGFASIEQMEIKLNDGDWIGFSPRIESEGTEIASLVPVDPTANGATTVRLLSENKETIAEFDGLLLNDFNDIYLRTIDIAGSESKVDTLNDIFFKGKTHELLVLSTSSARPDAFFRNELNTVGKTFDFIDLVHDERKNQPRIWNPTFELMLSQYSEVLIYAKEDVVTNAQTNQEEIILEFAAPAIEAFVNGGGKIFINSSLPNVFNLGSPLFGILPVDSISNSDGANQARLPQDSLAVGLQGYPTLTSNALIGGLDPLYASSDAEVIYTAQLTKHGNFTGPDDNCIGVRRKVNGKVSMVFISVELQKVNKDPSAVTALFDHIFNQEFNW